MHPREKPPTTTGAELEVRLAALQAYWKRRGSAVDDIRHYPKQVVVEIRAAEPRPLTEYVLRYDDAGVVVGIKPA